MTTLQRRMKANLEQGIRLIGTLNQRPLSQGTLQQFQTINQELVAALPDLKLTMLHDDLFDIQQAMEHVETGSDLKQLLLPTYECYYLLLLTPYEKATITLPESVLAGSDREVHQRLMAEKQSYLKRTYAKTNPMKIIFSTLKIQFVDLGDQAVETTPKMLVNLFLYVTDADDPRIQSIDNYVKRYVS